jgi:hypothetical protein
MASKILFLVSAVVISLILPCSHVLGNERDSFNAQPDQTLYFQSTPSDLGGYLMNTNISSGKGLALHTNFLRNVNFTSPYLATNFTFQNITIAMYHEKILTYSMYNSFSVTLCFIDQDGLHEENFGSAIMDVGSNETLLTLNFITELYGRERLFVKVEFWGIFYVYWGNSTYPSGISYQGTAVFVPEFPSFLILPLIMITTLLGVIVYRKRTLKIERPVQITETN